MRQFRLYSTFFCCLSVVLSTQCFSLSPFDHQVFYDYLLNSSIPQNLDYSDGYQLFVYLPQRQEEMQLSIHKDDPNMLTTIIKFCVDVQAKYDVCIRMRNEFYNAYGINLDSDENNLVFDAIFNLHNLEEFHLTQEEKRLSELNTVTNEDHLCHSGWVTTHNVSDTNYTNANYINNNVRPHNLSYHMYVVTHDDASEQALYSTLYNVKRTDINNTPTLFWFNNLSVVRVRSTVFFEYILYKDILPFSFHHYHQPNSNINKQQVSWGELDYVGVTSYKTMSEYYSLCRHEIDRLLTVLATRRNTQQNSGNNNTNKTTQYDVIPLIRSKQSLLIGAVFFHGTKFKEVWDAVLLSLGYNETIIRRHDHIRPFYRNSYLIRPEWLKKLTVFMNNAIDAVLLNCTLYDVLAQPCVYAGQRKKIVAQRVFNSDTYQYFPFVFERLPVFFLTVSGANICHGDVEDCPYNTQW